MLSLARFLVALAAAAALTGCVVAPVGPPRGYVGVGVDVGGGYYNRGYYRGDYYGGRYGRGYYGRDHDRHHGHRRHRGW